MRLSFLILGLVTTLMSCAEKGTQNWTRFTARANDSESDDPKSYAATKAKAEAAKVDRTAEVIKQECGIDMSATSGAAADKPLFTVQKPLALNVNGNISELTDMILKDQNLNGFFESILNLATLVTGRTFTLNADLQISLNSSISGNTINFNGKVAKLALDRFENSETITKLLTDAGNALAAGMLSRTVKSEFVSIKERIQSNNPQMMNTLCTLLLTKKMVIQSMAKTTVVFDPPLPTALNPFAKDSIYADQLGESFTMKSKATIESTDNMMLTSGTSFEVTATLKRMPLEQLDYCSQPIADAVVYRLTLSTEDPALLGTVGIMRQLDFYKKQGKVGEAFAGIGADAGIDIVKKPLCIRL